MRAKLTDTQGLVRYEWIIVSRWGSTGEHLTVGRTRMPAEPSDVAPFELAPCETALAGLLPLPRAPWPPTFLLAQNLPEAINVAGDFAPAEGYVCLHGRGNDMQLCAEGRGVGGAVPSVWRIEAARVAWIGEFIEEAARPSR